MSPEHYFRSLAAIFFAAVFIFLGFVFTMNPYALFDLPAFPLSANKYKMDLYERIIKPLAVSRLEPNSVILGTSRSAVGLDPVVLSRYTKRSAYNFGVNGSAIDEIAAALHVAVRKGHVKHVVYGIDYLQFNSSNPTGARQLGLLENGSGWQIFVTYAEMTVSLKALIDAGETLLKNALNLPPSHSALGQYIGYEPSSAPFIGHRGRQALPTEESYEIFDAMLSFARDQGLQLHLFVSPTYLSHLDNDPGIAEWADRLTAIAGTYGYSIDRIDIDASFAARRDDYWDPGHYRSAMGDRILKRLFAGGPAQ